MLRKWIQRVEYEGLKQIFFHYGRYGHKKDSCPDRIVNDKEGTVTIEANGDGGTVVTEELNAKQEAPTSDERYGSWMVVQRQPRNKQGQRAPHQNATGNRIRPKRDTTRTTGSRFVPLVAESDQDPHGNHIANSDHNDRSPYGK